MMKSSDRVVYVSLALGQPHGATVNQIRLNGTVDLAVDTGHEHPLHLTKIVVDNEGKPGTCHERQ